MPAPDDPRLWSAQCEDLKPVTIVHENPWFKVLNRGGRFTVEYNAPQVVVLPVVDGASILLIRAKRPVICDAPLELPAGAMEPGESPLDTARRELAEETGVTVEDPSRLRQLPPFSNSPNRNPRLVHVVRADIRPVEFARRLAHDAEVKEVVVLTRDGVRSALIDGEIYVAAAAATIACHFLLAPG